MLKNIFIVTILILSGCTEKNKDLAAGQSNVEITEQEILKQANRDFNLVLLGKSPENAVIDKSLPLPTDGGTKYYKGKGYTLEIKKTLSDDGDGYIYGPIVRFDNIIEQGKPKILESTKFYTTDSLNKLMEYKN